MLKQELASDEQTSSPAQVRVSPEELAKALAVLEARKEQSAREQENTIPIGEAVRQLGFDATPEEVWAQVQAERAKTAGRSTRRRVLWPGAVGLSLLILGGVRFFGAHQDADQPQSSVVTASPQPASATSQNITVTQEMSTGPVIKLLSEVPDDRPVTCLYDDASRIAPGHLARSGGYPSAGDTVNDMKKAVWTLVKHGGKVYLCGWTKARVSDRAIGVTEFTVYSRKQATDEAAVPVTLPLGQFHSDVSEASYVDPNEWEAITVSGVHPDKSLWRSW